VGNEPIPGFWGSDLYSLDDKSRLAIPSSYRYRLSPSARGTFVLAPGLGRCVAAWPLNIWQELLERAESLELPDEEFLRYIRWLYGSAVECLLDGQGRVRIPLHLVNFAGLKGDVQVVGMRDRIEIWHPDNYPAATGDTTFDYQAPHRQLLVGRRLRPAAEGAKPAMLPGLPTGDE